MALQTHPSKFKAWLEATRPRTLPVSVAGVVAAGGCAAFYGQFRILPFLICLIFALLAQIVSNFANEYFDFKNGSDKKGREGFRRGVTEGDITPKAMRNATYGLLAMDCLIGLTLIIWGGFWLIAVGLFIALFALAYSAGPYPLSRHALGELAVFIFYGLIPVIMTTYVQMGSFKGWTLSLPVAAAIGFMAMNVLIVNNYRDVEDDKAAGKVTTVVKFGRPVMANLYFVNGIFAIVCIFIAGVSRFPIIWLLAGILVYANLHYILYMRLKLSDGSELNPILGKTAVLMLGVSLWLTLMLGFH